MQEGLKGGCAIIPMLHATVTPFWYSVPRCLLAFVQPAMTAREGGKEGGARDNFLLRRRKEGRKEDERGRRKQENAT